MSVQHLLDHRHEALRMSAANYLVAGRDNCPVPLQQGGGAGGGRRVEREDQRKDSYCLADMEAQAAGRGKQKAKNINEIRSSDGFDRLDFRDVMLDQALDTTLQRDHR